jgi:ketosteroid isomerase-like protein
VSDSNVENLRAVLEGWDPEAWKRGENMSILAPDVTYEETILPDHVGETYRGHEGIARSARRWLEPFEEPRVDLEEIVGNGDHIVSIQRFRARAAHTGIEVDVVYAYHWTFQDGKVVHFCSFLDPADALRDAGLARSYGL